MSDQPAEREIVIVRRRGGDGEDGHHGGAWKIAYADFMTAMMAFFLVMWLVNAADKKVITQVASYFNPLKMSDRTTSKKGIEDLIEANKALPAAEKEQADAAGKGGSKPADAHPAEKTKAEKEDSSKAENEERQANGQTDFSEQEMFNDPYGILEKLAAEAIVGKQGVKSEDSGLGTEKLSGTAFRDPFDPDFNRVTIPGEQIELGQAGAADVAALQANPESSDAEESPAAREEAAAAPPEQPAAEPLQQPDKDAKDAKALEVKIQQAISDLSPGQRPIIKVETVGEGLLVSLTDDFDFEMFSVSSAKPSAQLVASMERLSKVINDTPGELVVRGHTDARPFRKGTSDNWVLSTQRALMSRYMLIKGGIAEARVARVEGYADTVPRMPDNRRAAQNRRIEILIRKPRA